MEELQRYRSEFFGRLRDVLQNRPGIQIVGDRFVFQSEVLFPAGSADMTASGQDQIRALAATLKQIIPEIPSDLNWILRVDGHADKQQARRRRLCHQLGALGAAGDQRGQAARRRGHRRPSHLAATGFGEFQPLDTADTAAAYARNRRIELRLTDR